MYNFTFIHLCNPSASQFSFRIAKIRVILSIQSTGLVNKMEDRQGGSLTGLLSVYKLFIYFVGEPP